MLLMRRVKESTLQLHNLSILFINIYTNLIVDSGLYMQCFTCLNFLAESHGFNTYLIPLVSTMQMTEH